VFLNTGVQGTVAHHSFTKMKPNKPIDSLIFNLRDKNVILDTDLAEIYGVQTKRLNEAINRNIERFPLDFMFQLTKEEWGVLKEGKASTNLQHVDITEDPTLRSQIATLKRGQHRKYLPFAFTEHGAIMAATVLNSPEAVAMSVYIVRAFIQMRERIAANIEIMKRLAEIDQILLKHDKSLQIIWAQLQPLLTPPPAPTRKRIGFDQDGE
jgi:phage regulator Rha-like protein